MTPRFLIGSALIALSLPMSAFAISVGETTGNDANEIRAMLEAEGYTVLEIETEDGEIEVEYEKDGQAYEMEIDMASGRVLEIELEDDD